MASLYLRNKVYWGRVRINGKEIRKPLSTHKAIAEERLGDLVKQRNAARHGHAPVNVSWQAFKSEFLKNSEPPAKKRSTWQAEVRAFREMETATPVYKLHQITPQFLDSVKTLWLKAGRGKYVINRDLRTIRTAMKKAEAYGYLARQDWTTNKYIKTPKGRLHFFTIPDLLKLKKVCRGIWRTALYLGARAGLRREEIRTLTWKEVDFERNRVHIAPTEEWTPKDYERRFIPMVEDLRMYLENAVKTNDGDTYVFSEEGQRPTLGSMTSYFKRLVKKAGLKGSIHTLRHSFGSHLASSGAPAAAIQAMMGHASLKTTEIYMHLAPGTSEDAIKMLPKLKESGHRNGHNKYALRRKKQESTSQGRS